VTTVHGEGAAAAAPSSVAVVGPGAIGTTLAAALHEAGRGALLCGRTPRERLELSVGEHRIVVPGPVLLDPAAVGEPVDLVLLAVKAIQVAAAAPWLAALCRPDTVVCVLQNGVEQEELVRAHLRAARVVPAVVHFPAEARPDGSVRLRGPARLTLPEGPASGVVVQALRGTRCSVTPVADFPSAAWRKLLQNAAGGLMALTGRRAGVFARDDVAALALAYLRECLAVARAEGAVLGDEVPQEVLDGFRAAPGDLGSSVLADRAAGRPLEWEVRNGVVQRRGRLHGVPTPVGDLLVTLLAAASDGPG